MYIGIEIDSYTLGAFHALKVTVKRYNVKTLRARRNYCFKDSAAALASAFAASKSASA